MENFTPLIREYKESNNPALMNKIYQELSPVIKSKASFIFYKKYYPLSLYNRCYSCQNCENRLKSNCKICKKCTCIKGTFNLSKTGLCELEDVENDLWVEVLRIIKNYDISKDFDTYFYSCIWNIIPSFLTMDFIKSVDNESLTKTYKNSGEDFQFQPLVEELENTVEKNIKLEIIFNSCKTDIEKNILKAISAGYNQGDIAKQLNVTQRYISMVIKDVKERIQNIIKEEE